jgi:hypothetical protein
MFTDVFVEHPGPDMTENLPPEDDVRLERSILKHGSTLATLNL